MSKEYLIKVKPQDFCVQELQKLEFGNGPYMVYDLNKCGLRTIECVDKIAAMLQLPITAISYAGLKDEDGVTSQYIAVKGGKEEVLQYSTEDTYFNAKPIGTMEQPFRVGKLQGNHFSIVIRQLEGQIAAMAAGKTRTIKVINYYDTQRFGMPGLPKVTHYIGQKLLEGNYEAALYYLYYSGNISETEYQGQLPRAQAYFADLDTRRFNFFLGAYDSYIWNEQVKELLRQHQVDCGTYEKEGFVFLLGDEVGLEKISCTQPIIRHERDDAGIIQSRISKRDLYNRVVYRAGSHMEDELHPGYKKLMLQFNLGGGRYASTVIDQLVNQLYVNAGLQTSMELIS